MNQNLISIMYKEKRFLLKIKFNSKTIIIILNFDNCFPKWFQRMSLEFNETFLMGDLFCRSQVDGLKNKSILAREKLEIHFPHWQTPSDYPRNTDIRAIFHGVMFLRISGFFFVLLYFERLYIFQDLNLEETLPSIRKRYLPGARIDPTTLGLRSQSTAIELSRLDGGRDVDLLPHHAITLLISNYLIWA